MGFWKSVTRELGAGDAEYWRQPGFFRLRHAGDFGPRLLYSLGLGFGITSPVVALLLLSAPADQLINAVWMAIGVVLSITLAAFLWIDLVVVTIAIEESGIRRTTRPLLMNFLGARNRVELFKYGSIRSCGIVSGDDLGVKHSVLVLATPGRMISLGIPPHVDSQQVAKQLSVHGLACKRLKSLPVEALPAGSVNGRGMTIAAVVAGVGLLLSLGGFGARTLVRGNAPQVLDMLAVDKSMANVPQGTTLRSLTGVGAGGLKHGQLSSDGHWVWGVDKGTQKHLVWRDTQDAPLGELPIPAADRSFAEFTGDGQRLVVCADRAAHVYRLEPLELANQFELKENPDAMVATPDGRQIVVVTMTSVRVYDLEKGQPVAEHMNLPPNAVLGAVMTEDGQAVRVVCQPRILEIRLKEGTSTELTAFAQPQKVYFFGSLAAGGRMAAMQAGRGIEVFDLDHKTQASVVAGLGFIRPVCTSDGALVAAPYLNGNGVWEVATGKPLVKFVDCPPAQLCLSADGKRLLGWSTAAAPVMLWEMPNR